MLSVAVIGHRNHARRIIDLIASSGMAEVGSVFHPTSTESDFRLTNNLHDLLQADALFILSPNATHFEYLNYFCPIYEGYIFCEKPPVNTPQQLRDLIFDPERTYFDFNYRHSIICDWLRDEGTKSAIGDPVFAEVSVTHGLAFKPDYADTWRADKSRHPLGIVETLAVHWLDFFTMFFGEVRHFDVKLRTVSAIGSAADTAVITCVHEQGPTSAIFVSYASCRSTRFLFQGTNGMLEYHGGALSIRSPRETFDDEGRFADPPILRRKEITWQSIYRTSLRESVNIFLSICEKGEKFPPQWAAASISANELLFRIAEASLDSG